MNQFVEKSLSDLTGKHHIGSATIEELELITKEYPYFSPARFLLAKKLKAVAHTSFEAQVQKTALFFTNVYWLHFALQSEEDFSILETVNIAETKTNNVKLLPGLGDKLDEKQQQTIVDHQEIKEEPVEGEKADSFVPDLPDGVTDKNEVAEEKSEPINLFELWGGTSPTVSEEKAEDEIVPDEFHPEPEIILEEIEEKISADEENGEEHLAVDDTKADEPKEQKLEPEDHEIPLATSSEDIRPQSENYEHHSDRPPEAADANTNLEVEPTDHHNRQEHSVENVAEVSTIADENHADEHVNDLSEPERTAENPGVSHFTETAEPLVPFEPLYSVDYFASQGIKLLLEKYPQDKLGKQLRSFTDWLKHMKKLGPEDALPTTYDEKMELTIQRIADNSNIPRDIITETMAEVLIKQGKTEQAIELYNKLSFMNPGKSAYFADKIQNLKR